MIEYHIKIRNDAKKINLSNLKSDSLKFKFKLKGLYKEHKFKAEVSLIVALVNNKLKITDVSIYDLDVDVHKSSSDIIFKNIYTTIPSEFIDNENLIKKIYKKLKSFIYNFQITKNNDSITSIVFDSRNSKIKKLNIKGYVRKY